MKFGPEVSSYGCGFSPQVNEQICGVRPASHGRVTNSNGETYLMACSNHQTAMRSLADASHTVTPACLQVDEGYWLDRVDGTSFCYFPDEEAEMQAELAAGASMHELVSV